jgi:putative membrane protein (TIGR04086 family)
MPYKPPKTASPAFSYPSIFKGTAAAVLLTLTGTFFLSLIYHFTGLKESTLPLVGLILLLSSVFLGGFMASRQSGNRGLFHGLGVGIVFFLFIWIMMGLFLPAGTAFIPIIQKLLVCLAGGALGGILGVGL